MTFRPAAMDDFAAICQRDHHVAAEVLREKITRCEVFAAYDGEVFAGWLRYSLFWDNTPFLNMLFLLPEYRGKGLGRAFTRYWEGEMKALGHRVLLTSAQQNESAQHFYTALGYQSIGGFVLPGEPLEIVFRKEL